MKKQINLALLLGFLFVAWLFFNSLVEHKIIFSKKKAYTKQEWILKDTDDITPVMYNKKTGEAFRYFRNWNDDETEIKDEGWTPLLYSDPYNEYKWTTPESIAREVNTNLSIKKYDFTGLMDGESSDSDISN